MDRPRRFIYPLLIFIFSTIAVVLSLFLYIYWYVEVSTGLEAVIRKSNIDPGQVLASQTWMVILVLSILVGIILAGILLIFFYFQKTLQFYRLQNNFINNFTHELKTPVTSMKLYLDTFRKYELSRADQLKYVGYMITDADRLSNNVNRILNLAKIESKTYQGEFTLEALDVVIEQFYQKNRHLFGETLVEIQKDMALPLRCRIDLSLFEMLLMNIFTNAVKYNFSARPRIVIHFEMVERNLRIHFEDNGIGLPEKETKRIFKKFYQVGRSDDMSAKGSGVGLYLVDVIARLHKGKITARNQTQGHGSVFTLTLPHSQMAPTE